jgi:DNA repair protein RadC
MKRQSRGRIYLIREIKVMTIRESAPLVCADNSDDCAEFWRETIATSPWFDPCKEHLVILLLNLRWQLFAYNVVSVGCLNASIAHPREILRPAIVAAAYGFILMHNHPSDCTRPSAEDRCVTTAVRKASYLMQIRFLDHLIVGESSEYYSFRAQNKRWW